MGGGSVRAQQSAPDSSTKTIVFTGGAGRLGRALREELACDLAAIRIVDIEDPGPLRENESWQRVDICDLDALTQCLKGADAVVHFAGYPNERAIEDILRVNVLGTHNIYEAARRAGVGRVVFGSSNHVVGFYPRDLRVGSDVFMRPDSIYGLSKCWSELEAGLYYEKAGITSLNIRIGHAGKPPNDPRALAVWVSARDLAQLVLIGIGHPDIECDTVFGVSENDSGWWDNSVATGLGYRPRDRAIDFALPQAFEPEQPQVPGVTDYFKGGRFCAFNHDSVPRRRRIGRPASPGHMKD
ncbi:NAD-dependent epimerase/dehydratase family protein [Pelagibacterium limicola]|uniref:NAD-dependent epimerase/dehydratase family protein n=1 Tax=Pelagibacterium limicola TaxID=2791022 RepID=UPI0018AFAEAE